MKTLEIISEALTEGSAESQLGSILRNCNQFQLIDVIKHLLVFYDKSPELLQEYFNHKSDASPLEATEQENLELDFKKWLLVKNIKG